MNRLNNLEIFQDEEIENELQALKTPGVKKPSSKKKDDSTSKQ